MPATELRSSCKKSLRTPLADILLKAFRQLLLKLCFVGAIMLLLSDCKRELIAPRPGELRFSREVVEFDSLFSTVLSPTQRLWVYNPHSFPVSIRSVRLERGGSSPFRFVLDGQEGPILTAYTLRPKDSVQVFLQLRDTTLRDRVQEDRLLFETEAGTQAVLLRVTLLAAYVYRDFGFDSAIVSLPNDKPVVIDGFFYVGPAAVLRILPGTRLYFSGRRWESGPLQGELSSGLYIAGQLEALGTPTQPISLQGWRLEPYYAQAPGQWQGLWFFPTSTANRLLYTYISQASLAVRVDSAGDASAPKIYMEGCLIRDAANYGIVAQGFSPTLPPQPILHAVNTLIYRCGQACAAFVGGGTYRLVHCAFLFDQGDLRRGITSLVVSDYLEATQGELRYPLDFWALNTLLWSTKEDAVAADLRGSPVRWYFDHCALRQKEALPGTGVLYGTSFSLGAAEEAYPLQEASPLIDAGRYDAQFSPTYDRLGRPRDAQPDIGVYEQLR